MIEKVISNIGKDGYEFIKNNLDNFKKLGYMVDVYDQSRDIGFNYGYKYEPDNIEITIKLKKFTKKTDIEKNGF